MPTTLNKPVLSRDIKRCPGCGDKVYSQGRCKTHYEHIRRCIRSRRKVRVGRRSVPLTAKLAVRLGYLAPSFRDLKTRVNVLVPIDPEPYRATVEMCPCNRGPVYSRGRCKGCYSSVRRSISLCRQVKYEDKLQPITEGIAVALGLLDPVKEKDKELAAVFKLVKP
jgi:hypothetical protein